MPREGEADPDTRTRAIVDSLTLNEQLEDARQHRRVDSRAIVDDTDDGHTGASPRQLLALDRESDSPSAGSELRGIAEEIREDLFDSTCIPQDPDGFLGYGDIDRLTEATTIVFRPCDGVTSNRLEVHRGEAQVDLAMGDTGHVE